MYKVSFEIFYKDKTIYRKRSLKFDDIHNFIKYFRDNMDKIHTITIIKRFENFISIFDRIFAPNDENDYYLRIKVNSKFFKIKLTNIRDYQSVIIDNYGWKYYEFFIHKKLITKLYIN